MILRTGWVTCTVLIPMLFLTAVACGGDRTVNIPAGPIQPSNESAGPTPTVAHLQIAIASTDLNVGPNRLVFGLIDTEAGPVRGSDVEVSTFYLTQAGQEGPIETVKAVFRKWPSGPGGVYTAQLTFDRPGTCQSPDSCWGIGITITEEDGLVRASSTTLQVNEESKTPAIGSHAPRSMNKTARDVERLEEITTDPEPTAELYAMTIAEALDVHKPLMVVFATPAYCKTITCGPQLDIVKELNQQYNDRMNFIHIEVYDNPLEIQGDLSRGRLSPTITEWNMITEPWTFMIDNEGIVTAKFEAFTTREELDAAVADVLK